MLKSFKTEINPTAEQIIKISRTIGTCRFIYNFYLSHNKKLYEGKKEFISSKSIKKSIEDGYKAFINFF